MSYAAESYENYMVPGLFAPWSSHLIQIANPQPGERVLDVRSEERRVGKECRSLCDWSSDVCSSDLAESYENYMVPGLFAPWSSHLIQIANPQPGERVLDVACGTGIVARQIAPRVGPQGIIIGLDLDPDKINVARATAKREGLAIEWKTKIGR